MKIVCPACTTSPEFAERRGDGTLQPRLELGIADAVLGDLDLGLGIIYSCLRRPQSLLSLVEIDPRRPTLLQQGLLAIKMVGILLQPTLGGGKRSTCRAQPIQFILRIELGQYLIGRDAIAGIRQAFHD